MGKSSFQKYWSRIDNSPGTLDYASKEQLVRVKQMVKAAYHAGHGEYRKRIKELEERCKGAEELAHSEHKNMLAYRNRRIALRAKLRELADEYDDIGCDVGGSGDDNAANRMAAYTDKLRALLGKESEDG